MKGKLEPRISRGTDTTTFLEQNFRRGRYDEIVYVTANPFVDKLLKGKFHDIVSVWKTGWNEEFETVMPETMYEYAVKAARDYPDKRLVIHFMQPHYPYIEYVQKGDGRKYVEPLSLFADHFSATIEKSERIQLYVRNLELALPHVERLAASLAGITVVSADHGEAFGDAVPHTPFRVHGHPPDVRIAALTQVPWFVVENGPKVRYADQPKKREESVLSEQEESVIEDRLRALGYE